MSFSTLPLSYCTNVHPGRTLDEVRHGLDNYTRPLRQAVDSPVAAGLWLSRNVVSELTVDRATTEQFSAWLTERDLPCYTLNAFPFGDFHSERVKENVYLPDWTSDQRLDYTLACERILAGLLPPDTEGSISTVPLGFGGFDHADDFEQKCCVQLIQLSRELAALESETGRTIRLAIEPEPLCVLERIPDQTIPFFERLRKQAAKVGAAFLVKRFVGVCYDVCHQSVEFEDVAESVRLLNAADIRINKVHITCAVELPDPKNNVSGRDALSKFVEPRYLHQTMARMSDGRVLTHLDLDHQLLNDAGSPFMEAESWRIHFHVPVNADELGPLKTTRDDLRAALTAVKDLAYEPHLEVETYTWDVLPGGNDVDLVTGLAAELTATRQLLNELT